VIKKISVNWLFFVGAYLISAGGVFAAMSLGSSGNIVSPVSDSKVSAPGEIDLSTPKNQQCPINGKMYTESEKDIWQTRKPLLVMIENHEDSRPQSGLSRADVVYEAVAEGAITRFLAVFYCGAAAPAERKYDLGPVRSARTYFLDWASEYDENPLYVHVGGAGNCSDTTVDTRAKALCQIENYGWKDSGSWSDMDQFALPYSACRREPERTGETRATEHTMYCDTTSLWQVAEERGFGGWEASNFISWKFKDDDSLEKRGSDDKIEIYFWQGYGAYGVTWDYSKDTNSYVRSNGGQIQNDFLTGNSIEARVVIAQFTKEIGPIGDHKHMLYTTIGKGDAIIFQDGKAIKGSWNKKDRQSRTIFYDNSGEEIELNRGLVWIEILPIGNKVAYGSK
jgi:hypothetical protein